MFKLKQLVKLKRRRLNYFMLRIDFIFFISLFRINLLQTTKSKRHQTYSFLL